MNTLQREFGKVEAKVDNLTEDIKELREDNKSIKNDLAYIKKRMEGEDAVRVNDLKRLSLVGAVAAAGTQILNWIKPFVS